MSAPNVLIVEDNDDVSYLIRFLLEREGWRVEVARNGDEAEKMFASMQPPGLIVLDVMLPYVDGFELLRELRARKGWAAVPVMMLTAKSQEADIVRALEAGASDYVVKPFKPNELLARVKRLLKEGAP